MLLCVDNIDRLLWDFFNQFFFSAQKKLKKNLFKRLCYMNKY
uniref:Uncharacterized protein n=1 Tax=viral metagenome TaxID=1070528 RepID=A0A6C0CAP3_9ZZZZ